MESSTCFFVSPIGEEGSAERQAADEVFELIVEEACRTSSLAVVRADHIAAPGPITPQVLDLLISSDIVIADLTASNPNVMYELAIRHIANKPAIIIVSKTDSRIPFDIKDERTIYYDIQSTRSVNQCVNKLRKVIEFCLKKKDETFNWAPFHVAADFLKIRTATSEQVLPELRVALSALEAEVAQTRESLTRLDGRLAEPYTSARESIMTIGQAVRREVNAMGDGVERAIARAAELEALVHNEVAALERAHNDNEVRIRGLIEDLAIQRNSLVSQAEQLRNTITGIHLGLMQDIVSMSEQVTTSVNDAGQRVARTLAEKGEHITLALGRAGDTMIDAIGERGADLLEQLTRVGEEVARKFDGANIAEIKNLSASLDKLRSDIATLSKRLDNTRAAPTRAESHQVEAYPDFLK